MQLPKGIVLMQIELLPELIQILETKGYSQSNFSITVQSNYRYMRERFQNYYKGLGIKKFCFVFILVGKGDAFRIRKKYSR